MAERIDRERLLARAAGRAVGEHFFLAAALVAFQESRGLDDAGLAGYLGCAPSRLSRLALCRRPDGASPAFRDEVKRLSAYAGADADALLRLLREADALKALRGGDAGTMLLAARDADVTGDGER